MEWPTGHRGLGSPWWQTCLQSHIFHIEKWYAVPVTTCRDFDINDKPIADSSDYVPVQKEKRCPLCGSACENSFNHWRCTRSACDWCDLCDGRCERNTANGCKGVPGPSGPPSALDTQVGGDHYKDMAIQPIEFCTKNGIGFAEGLAIKHICRHEKKHGARDLDKAIHTLQILRELKYGKPS